MKLFIKDRLIIAQIMPVTGSLAKIGSKKDIMTKIVIPAEEKELINFVADDKNITWDDKKDDGIDVAFSESELNYLQGIVNTMDSSEQINDEIYDTCKKIKQAF